MTYVVFIERDGMMVPCAGPLDREAASVKVGELLAEGEPRVEAVEQ